MIGSFVIEFQSEGLVVSDVETIFHYGIENCSKICFCYHFLKFFVRDLNWFAIHKRLLI